MSKKTKEDREKIELAINIACNYFKLDQNAFYVNIEEQPLYKTKKAKRLTIAMAQQLGVDLEKATKSLNYRKSVIKKVMSSMSSYPVPKETIKKATKQYAEKTRDNKKRRA